jgi:hypothetical protein
MTPFSIDPSTKSAGGSASTLSSSCFMRSRRDGSAHTAHGRTHDSANTESAACNMEQKGTAQPDIAPRRSKRSGTQ